MIRSISDISEEHLRFLLTWFWRVEHCRQSQTRLLISWSCVIRGISVLWFTQYCLKYYSKGQCFCRKTMFWPKTHLLKPVLMTVGALGEELVQYCAMSLITTEASRCKVSCDWSVHMISSGQTCETLVKEERMWQRSNSQHARHLGIIKTGAFQ